MTRSEEGPKMNHGGRTGGCVAGGGLSTPEEAGALGRAELRGRRGVLGAVDDGVIEGTDEIDANDACVSARDAARAC